MSTDIIRYHKQLTKGCYGRRSGKTFVACKQLIGSIYLATPGIDVFGHIVRDKDIYHIKPILLELFEEHKLIYTFSNLRRCFVVKKDKEEGILVEFSSQDLTLPSSRPRIKVDFRDYG